MIAHGRNGEGLPGDAHIRTFLIADVRGYTVFTQEHGDEAAAELAREFAAVARSILEARGGSGLELRGDEVMAVFDSARQAIRAAIELQRRFVDETVVDRADEGDQGAHGRRVPPVPPSGGRLRVTSSWWSGRSSWTTPALPVACPRDILDASV